jgi:hypothetical protein
MRKAELNSSPVMIHDYQHEERSNVVISLFFILG